jgi:hypothetical protein
MSGIRRLVRGSPAIAGSRPRDLRTQGDGLPPEARCGVAKTVANLRAIDMSMRADQDVIADDNRVAGPAVAQLMDMLISDSWVDTSSSPNSRVSNG